MRFGGLLSCLGTGVCKVFDDTVRKCGACAKAKSYLLILALRLDIMGGAVARQASFWATFDTEP